jgi:UDP-glucose:(heptosyl)LPS alpha-1,3-glucosyltransferase
MKLAVVRRKYNPYGGAERFLESLRTQLVERNISVSVIAETWKTVDYESDSVVKIKASGFFRSTRFRSFSQNVQTFLTNQQFDLIQSHERLTGVDIYRLGDGIHAAWLERCARVSGSAKTLLRKIDSYNRAVIMTESQMAMDDRLHFVATSKLVLEELKSFYNVPEDRIFTIPNGVDVKRFSPATSDQKIKAREALGIPQSALVVGFVGSDFTRKGLWPLARAIMMSRDLYLVVAGRDSSSEKLNKLISDAGVKSSIRYLGPVDNVLSLLWASDVFALPSLYEPSSNAILEAMSCGLPIVCTESVGNANIVREQNCGYICDRDPESILEGLRYVLSSDRYEALSANCRLAAKQIVQEPIIDKWLKLYDTVLNKKSA